MKYLHWLCVPTLLACSSGNSTTAAPSAAHPPANPLATVSPAAAEGQQAQPPNAAPDVATYPVHWWAGLELKSLPEASTLYAATHPDDFGDLQRGDTTKHPDNCNEWKQLHADGFDPTTTIEMQADGGAKVRCTTLQMLQRAQPAKVSYVRDLAWDSSLLSVLPAALATSFDDDQERALTEATAKGQSLAQFDPRAKLKPWGEEHAVQVAEGDGETMIVVHAQAWGDFNDDGFDDVSVSVVNAATHGTLSYVRLLTLSRKSSGALLTVNATN
jgi:hypothetical protein